jgi:hypothetical protein
MSIAHARDTPFCLSLKKGAVICGRMSGGRSIALQNIDKRNRVSIEGNGAMPVAPLDSQPVSTIRHTSQAIRTCKTETFECALHHLPRENSH